jgi:hypothetical protein
MDLPLRSLFEAPTIVALAMLIEQKQATLIEQADSEELVQMLTVLENMSEDEIRTRFNSDS